MTRSLTEYVLLKLCLRKGTHLAFTVIQLYKFIFFRFVSVVPMARKCSERRCQVINSPTSHSGDSGFVSFTTVNTNHPIIWRRTV